MRTLTIAFALSFFTLFSFAQKKEKGWIRLFDGKTTNGWHSYGQATIGNGWKAIDGELKLDASQKDADIVTNEEFENFDLKLEWKISKNGNSGILFLVHEDTAKYHQTYYTGPEMQVLDNDGHPDGKIHKHRAGDLYDLIACSTETVKPVGEWNTAEIICNKGKLQFILNGTKVVETTLWNDEWKQLVEGSKFKALKGFGTYHKGRIALQYHDSDVSFRNIVIKKL